MTERDRESDKEQYARFFESAVKQAQAGDRQMAESLIGQFAQLADDPHVFDSVGGIPAALIQHIASCLGDWKKRDFKDAETRFYLKRATHRPKREIDGRHIAALREYRIQRLVKKAIAPDAYASAAELSGLTEGQVRALVQDQRNEHTKDEVLEAIAMEGVTPPSDSTAPCLPRKTKGKGSR